MAGIVISDQIALRIGEAGRKNGVKNLTALGGRRVKVHQLDLIIEHL